MLLRVLLYELLPLRRSLRQHTVNWKAWLPPTDNFLNDATNLRKKLHGGFTRNTTANLEMLTVNRDICSGACECRVLEGLQLFLVARTKVVLFLHFRIKGLRGHAFMQITKILLFVFAVISLDKSQSIATVSQLIEKKIETRFQRSLIQT